MKKIFFLLVFAALFALQSCTKTVAQEPAPMVSAVKVQDLSAGQEIANPVITPIKLQVPSSTGADSTIVLNVVFSQPSPGISVGAWLGQNIWGIVGVFVFILQVVVNMTPTDKDNSIFLLLKRIFDFIVPNRKAGGGQF